MDDPSSPQSPKISKIMVFRPTLEEMKNFQKYLEYMESKGAHHGGLAKIIPPPEWCPRKDGYDDINFTVKSPIIQMVSGGGGVYQQLNFQRRSLSFREFSKIATARELLAPPHTDYDDLEQKYWQNVPYCDIVYGADVPGSLTDDDCEEFNCNKLSTILDMVTDSYGVKIMGVNTAYLYIGMWKASFAWHTEDMDLYSINYLHFGAPKSWYCVPAEYGKSFEKIAIEYFPRVYELCPAFLRHKMTIISPKILRKHSIPYNKITQEAGEFMITFPYCYHAGFNHGLNCAESTNFALPRWIEFGKRATVCHCRSDTVKINMDVFVKVFQPERYQNWLAGKDIGPDPKDPSVMSAAPSPYEIQNEYWDRITKKPKRQRYTRDLIEHEVARQLLLDCEQDIEDTDDSPDFSYGRNGNSKSRKRRLNKKNTTNRNAYKSLNKNNGKNGAVKCSNNKNKSDTEVKCQNNNVTINTPDDNNNNNDNNNNENDNNNSNKSTNMNGYTNGDIIPKSETKIVQKNQKIVNGDISVLEKPDMMHKKLLTFGTEVFDPEQPITSLDELSKLTWQYNYNPKAFEDEIKLNYYTSLIDPFCSICTILRSFSINQDLSRVNQNFRPPNDSQILIPKSLFISKVKQSNYLGNLSNQSSLLICINCKLCVHSSCYGINDTVNNPLEWKCDRCEANEWDAACCLCPIRGGALKTTLCNQWAHLTCALVLSNVKIETDMLMKPIDISAVQPLLDSDRTICCFCSQRSNHGHISNYIIGCCIRCSNNQCSEFFHVTCAYREGVLFELNDNLTSFKVTCKKCQSTKINRGIGKESESPNQKNSTDVDLDMIVIAKYDNYYFSYAKVVDKYDEFFHHVQFVDGKYVSNIHANDILNRDCTKEQPAFGDTIEVIWNKEQLHGKYAGFHKKQMYTVLFDNGTKLSLIREDVYLLNEEIPKRIFQKFVPSLKTID